MLHANLWNRGRPKVLLQTQSNFGTELQWIPATSTIEEKTGHVLYEHLVHYQLLQELFNFVLLEALL